MADTDGTGPGVRFGEREPSTHSKVYPGEQHEVPAVLAEITESRPGLSLDQLLPYSRNFKGSPLTPDQESAIAKYVDSLFKTTGAGQTVTGAVLDIKGFASDEDGSMGGGLDGTNIGVPSDNNRRLALRRAVVVGTFAEQHAKQKSYPLIITESGDEVVLNTDGLATISKVAAAHGMGVQQLTNAHNTSPKGGALSELEELLDHNRRADLAGTVTSRTKLPVGPCDEIVRLVQDPPVVIESQDRGSKGIPVLPFPGYILRRKRLRRNNASEQQPADDVVSDPPANETTEVSGATSDVATVVAPSEGNGAGVPVPAKPTALPRVPDTPNRPKGFDLPSKRVPGSRRKLAGTMALLAVLGWPRFSHETADVPTFPDASVCTTYNITPGSRINIGWTFIWEAITAKMKDEPVPEHELPLEYDLTRVSKTKAGYKKVFVDTTGAVVSTTIIPESKTGPTIITSTYSGNAK